MCVSVAYHCKQTPAPRLGGLRQPRTASSLVLGNCGGMSICGRAQPDASSWAPGHLQSDGGWDWSLPKPGCPRWRTHVVITRETGWDCGLDVDQVLRGMCPRGEHYKKPRWKLAPAPASIAQEHPSLCILLVRAVSGQLRVKGRGLAAPSAGRSSLQVQRREDQWCHP